MIISLIEGVQPVADDTHVLAQLRRAGARDPVFGASVLIAVANGQGEIYRIVLCQGMRQTERVTTCLRAMGFTEQYEIGSSFHFTFRR